MAPHVEQVTLQNLQERFSPLAIGDNGNFFQKTSAFEVARKDDQNAKRRNVVKQRTELKLCWLRSLSKLRQLGFYAVPRFILGYESEAFSETFPLTPDGHLVLQLAAPP